MAAVAGTWIDLRLSGITDAHSRHGGATFEVYEDRTGMFRFRLRVSTGQVAATSEAYETKAAARRGAESAQSAA